MTNVPENNYITTLNKTGVSTRYLDDMAQAGLRFAHGKGKPVLDLGCGFGAVTTALLAQGNHVLANDIDLGHLEALRKGTPPELSELLETICGAFPNEVKLSPNSLSAVISCWVVHFLSGSDIQKLAQLLHEALELGGKCFISASSPHVKFLGNFIPVYENRKTNGDEFPGWMSDVRMYLAQHQIDNLPPSMHFLDPAVLTRIFEAAGFKTEYAGFFRRDDVTEGMALGGEENVGIIAEKI